MDIRPLTPSYAVSPQIDPEDLPLIAAAGYTTIINNRPDPEIPPSHHGSVMKQAAKAAGLTYVELPLVHDALNPETAATQQSICDGATGPVFAYCASGTRCTIIWAITQVGHRDLDEIVNLAAAQGYDLRPMLGTLSLWASA